jgi:hypothetical protein
MIGVLYDRGCSAGVAGDCVGSPGDVPLAASLLRCAAESKRSTQHARWRLHATSDLGHTCSFGLPVQMICGRAAELQRLPSFVHPVSGDYRSRH